MTTAITSPEPQVWNSYQKLAFRFFMIFFLIFVCLDPNAVSLPGIEPAYNLYVNHIHDLISWLSQHILHTKPITIFPAGSGDTTYNYLELLFIATVAFTGTIIWTITDRKPKNYNKLFYWLCVILRYYVAINMASYGYAKIIKLQFPSPSLGRLQEPLGNMSPMGLAWTYMGYSAGFNYFTGFAELTCAALLFFRRTTTLGAIVGIAVAGNIMAINYCFDVPVKILSTMLFVMCVFLLVRDIPRLISFFFKNKTTPPANLSPHRFKARWKNIVLIVFKYAIVLYVLVGYFISCVQGNGGMLESNYKPALYGIYDVISFVRNKDTIAPITTDTLRWRKFWVSRADRAGLKFMDDSLKTFILEVDTTKHMLNLTRSTDSVKEYFFSYRLKHDTMLFDGVFKKDSIHVKLKKFDMKNFSLINRGFHWINEYPYNR